MEHGLNEGPVKSLSHEENILVQEKRVKTNQRNFCGGAKGHM
jgi:hypothetical protein